jgi:hypothetical protein
MARPLDALKERLRSWSRHPFSEANGVWTIAAVGLVLGLVVRLWSIGQARFGSEEAWFWSIGRDIATGREFPVLGAPITGSAARLPGAAYFWFLGLTQVPGPSPLRAYAVVSLGGLAALVALSVTVARAFDRATGLAFFLLGALSPWWIVYTNSSWPGYFFPTLCALALVWLPSLVDRPHPGAQAALAFLLVIGFQIHLSLMHYWLMVLVAIVIWRPKPSRALAVGAIVGCLCYVPYFIYEMTHGFANTMAIAHRSQGGGRSPFVLQGLLLYFLGFTTTDLSYLWNQGFWHPFDLARFWRGTGVDQSRVFFDRSGFSPVAWAALVTSWIFTFVSWGFFSREIWRRLRVNLRAPDNVLPVAFVTAVIGIVVLYLMSGKGGYPHYVSIVLPLAFLPPAFLLGRLFRGPVTRWGAGAFLCLFAAGGLLGLHGYYAVDSRWSIPQATAAVKFMLDRTRLPDGHQLPFRLELGFSPNWPTVYQQIATHVFRAPFPMIGDAPDVFRLEAKFPDQEVPRSPNAADDLILSTLVVRHLKLEPPLAPTPAPAR